MIRLFQPESFFVFCSLFGFNNRRNPSHSGHVEYQRKFSILKYRSAGKIGRFVYPFERVERFYQHILLVQSFFHT